ncbi:glycosyltransferase [Spirosoma arcticum]
MRILHVIAEIDPERGGVSQAVRTMISGLDREGVSNEVVSLDPPDAPFLANDPFHVHALGPRKGQWGYNPGLVSWLVENASQYTVILLHGLWLYPGYAAYKAIRMCKRKQPNGTHPRFFVMPHGMLDPWFQRASGRKTKALRNWVYWKLIERKVVAEADGLLFTCEAELQLAREPFRPYQPKSEQVVGLGVDEPPAYLPAMREAFLERCPELANTPYFLFLSRIHEKKGVDLLIRSYSKLAQKYSVAESGAYSKKGSEVSVLSRRMNMPKLVIAGPGLDTPYGQEMQQLASRLQDGTTSIFFPGMLTDNAKWGAFYGCEAFVLPSHQENFGIAVVEALACEKPVLISDQVNIWQEIETAGAGLVAADSLEGTEQLLDDWMNLSDDEKQTIRQQTLKLYRQYYAVEPAAKSMIDAITPVPARTKLLG